MNSIRLAQPINDCLTDISTSRSLKNRTQIANLLRLLGGENQSCWAQKSAIFSPTLPNLSAMIVGACLYASNPLGDRYDF